MSSQAEIKQPHTINCPCGCKALEGDDAIKRHLKILACIVFVATLGLVAVCSMARQNEGAAEPEIATAINYPPGAIQAAEGSFPVMTPTQSRPRVYAVVPMQDPEQMQLQMQMPYQVPVSTQGMVALPMTGVSQIRPEMPSHLTMAITSMDGKTKIKRIAGR
ncbi:hypothetical protein GC174_17200 [bacterium]|nr:hypothetical protein [bacterium]